MNQTANGADAFAPFQKALTDGWGKAIESLQGLGNAPKFAFSADKLEQLQKDYLAEAAALWQQGLSTKAATDKRFAGDAWGSNPVSSFTAAVYLLNGRTMLNMVEAVEGRSRRPSRACASRSSSGWPRRRRAIRSPSMPMRKCAPSRPRAKALPRASRT